VRLAQHDLVRVSTHWLTLTRARSCWQLHFFLWDHFHHTTSPSSAGTGKKQGNKHRKPQKTNTWNMKAVQMYSKTVQVHMQLKLAMKKDLRREKKTRKAERRSGMSPDFRERHE